MTPPITREARKYITAWFQPHTQAISAEGWQNFMKAICDMPDTPADPLDAVRARWQPTVRGFNVLILALHDGWIFGKAGLQPAVWDESDGRDIINDYHLQPASPHAALIAELREHEDRCYHDGMDDTARLFKRAADALEKQP